MKAFFCLGLRPCALPIGSSHTVEVPRFATFINIKKLHCPRRHVLQNPTTPLLNGSGIGRYKYCIVSWTAFIQNDTLSQIPIGV